MCFKRTLNLISDFVKTFWNLKAWVIIRGCCFIYFILILFPWIGRGQRNEFLKITVRNNYNHYVSFMTNAKNIWDHCTPEQFNPGGLQLTEPSAQSQFRRLFPFKSHFSHGGAKIWVIIFSYKVLYVPIIRVWNPFCK